MYICTNSLNLHIFSTLTLKLDQMEVSGQNAVVTQLLGVKYEHVELHHLSIIICINKLLQYEKYNIAENKNQRY